MAEKNCRHDWQDNYSNKYECSKCGEQRYKRFNYKDNDDLQYIIRDDGTSYNVRVDRSRYFYPYEWQNFIKSFSKKQNWHKLVFETLIKTGGRIEEVLFIRGNSLVDDYRKSLKLRVTKSKASKNEIEGKPRVFQIDSSLYNKLNRIKNGDEQKYLFLNIDKNLDKSEIKKHIQKKTIVLRRLLKRKLEKTGIQDYYNFSLHNIRKSHGMWLKTLGIDISEICNRLGHDYNTFLSHYGSPSIFEPKDKKEMIKILGDIYGLK